MIMITFYFQDVSEVNIQDEATTVFSRAKQVKDELENDIMMIDITLLFFISVYRRETWSDRTDRI